MKRATTIGEIPNAFPPSALTKEDLDEFYDADTMYVRTGDKYDSPIADIYDHCTDSAPAGPPGPRGPRSGGSRRAGSGGPRRRGR